jgi:hypothetical protein
VAPPVVSPDDSQPTTIRDLAQRRHLLFTMLTACAWRETSTRSLRVSLLALGLAALTGCVSVAAWRTIAYAPVAIERLSDLGTAAMKHVLQTAASRPSPSASSYDGARAVGSDAPQPLVGALPRSGHQGVRWRGSVPPCGWHHWSKVRRNHPHHVAPLTAQLLGFARHSRHWSNIKRSSAFSRLPASSQVLLDFEVSPTRVARFSLWSW